jgi:small redox-active disulfide protein 2
MKEILVLGPGCYRCQKLHESVETAVKELNLECQIFKVTDPAAIAGFGIMQTPALIIDGEMKAMGKMLSVDQVKKLLSEKS